MWLVRLALSRPYTFVLMALLIVLLGAVTIRAPRPQLRAGARVRIAQPETGTAAASNAKSEPPSEKGQPR